MREEVPNGGDGVLGGADPCCQEALLNILTAWRWSQAFHATLPILLLRFPSTLLQLFSTSSLFFHLYYY
jgi:hypothetical protein